MGIQYRKAKKLSTEGFMRNYTYHNKWQKLLTPEIVSLLTQIHEYKGEQNLFIEAQADTLTQLVEILKG